MSDSSRQLAAIMFTDIVGYTKLMGESEEQALDILKTNRAIHKKWLKKYNGKWLKEMGDGVLASFQTISDAVYCAGAIQENAKTHEGLNLRIGIHVGEVVIQNNDVFGDGVNIASRIEALAPANEIWVSESVYKNLLNKKGLELNFVGDETLKNVEEPVKIFSVNVNETVYQGHHHNSASGQSSSKWIRPVAMIIGIMIVLLLVLNILYLTPEGQTQAGTIDKSIAILPFNNISEDPDNTYYSDGMMVAVLNNLSKIQELTVLTRNSTERYRNTTLSATEIANELEVGSILSGSVQKSKNKLRINVTLTDGSSDVVIWSNSYDREIDDIFELQSDIAQEVANNLQAILSPEALSLIENRPTDNLEAYEYYMKGSEIFNNANNDDETESSVPFFQKAIELDSEFAEPYISLAQIYAYQRFDLNNQTTEIQDSVFALLDIAIKSNPDLPEAYRFKAWYSLFVLNDKEAVQREGNKAIALDPNDAEAYYILGYSNNMMAPPNYEKSLAYFTKAAELEKGENIQAILENIGFVYLGAGDFSKAEEYYLKSIEYNPVEANYNRIWWLHLVQGNFDQALYWAERSYEIHPNDNETMNEIARTYMYLGDYAKSAEYYELWHKAREDEYDEINYDVFNIGYGFVQLQLGNEDVANQIFQARLAHGEKVLSSGIWDGGGGEIYEQARIQTVLGNKQKAYQLLHEFEKSEFAWGSLYWMNIDPMFESLREEEEFKTILTKGFALKEERQRGLRMVEQNKDLSRVLNN